MAKSTLSRPKPFSRFGTLVKKLSTASRVALAIAICSATVGCHRQFYRKQADCEVKGLIQEKACHVARPPNTSLGIELDRRSRMFNPFDLDFQPMPLDDPASHRYMQCVDGRRGYPMWDAAGFTNTTESPDWWQFLPLDEEGVLVLNAETAVRIALLHSTDYQEQLEELYLSALDVSAERFQFDTQIFGGLDSFYQVDGPDRTGSGQSTTFSTGAFSNGGRDLALRRSFATGADLIAGVANNIVWELSGPNTQSASTVLDFTLTQPLLRQAGRDKILETLTRSERALLGNIRGFERYRRSFFLNITVGRGTEGGVNRSGGLFGVGLQGFTGLGGGFGGLGGGGGGGGFGGGGANVQQAGGFLGLLQDQLQIQNLEENISRLTENLLVLENTLVELLTTIPDDPEAIVRQRLQIAQARNALLNAESQLVGRQSAFQSSVDNFLADLGLPPYICVRIEDPMLERFELIDRDLRSRRQDLSLVRSNVGKLNVALLGESELITDAATGLPVSTLQWSPAVAEHIRQLTDELEPVQAFLSLLLNDDAPRVRADIEKLAEALPERVRQNAQLRELYEREQDSICSLLGVSQIDDSVFDIEELSGLQSELTESFDKLLERIQSYEGRIIAINASLKSVMETGAQETSPTKLADRVREEIILATQDLLSELGDDVLQFQLIQARARTESALLPEVNIEPETALEIARRNRRDWANARASLVDQWRVIEFIADDLESTLDVVMSGDVGNDGNNPFTINGNNSRLRVGLRWDAPITRLQERNNYRQTLIDYEQAKRSYYQFEDGIWRQLRAEIRQLRVNRFTFELGRQAVRIAAGQIELNEDIRILRDSRGLSSGPTAARDTISALQDLLNAQNSLLDIFVNYEVVRRGLDLDLGTMELTPEGLWIDHGKLEPEYLLSLPGTTSEALSTGACTDCGLRYKAPPEAPSYYGAMVSDPGLVEVEQVEFQQEVVAEPEVDPEP